jgi:hypothetical protein
MTQGARVGRGARTALDHVDHELLVVLAADDQAAGAVDRLGLVGGQQAELAVRAEAACLTTARATTKSRRCLTGTPVIGKFCTARSVCTPQ